VNPRSGYFTLRVPTAPPLNGRTLATYCAISAAIPATTDLHGPETPKASGRVTGTSIAKECLVKPSPDTYDVLPPSPTHWDDQAHERWMVPTLVPGEDFQAGSWAARDFGASDVLSTDSSQAAREFASDPLSSHGMRAVLSKSARVFGFSMMVLAVLVVVLDCLFDNQESSVFAGQVVGAVFTVGVFLAAHRK
jgi:hypothetical protein